MPFESVLQLGSQGFGGVADQGRFGLVFQGFGQLVFCKEVHCRFESRMVECQQFVNKSAHTVFFQFAMRYQHLAITYPSDIGDELLSVWSNEGGWIVADVVSVLQSDGVGVAKSVGWWRKRMTVECHVEKGGHKESLLYQTVGFGMQRSCEEVDDAAAG